MKIRKWATVLLAVVLAGSLLVGCGSSGADAGDDPAAAGGSIGSVIGYPPRR